MKFKEEILSDPEHVLKPEICKGCDETIFPDDFCYWSNLDKLYCVECFESIFKEAK